MTCFSEVTGGVGFVIVFEGHTHFYKKIQDALMLSGNLKTFVSQEIWLAGGQESLLSYSGIITIQDDILAKHEAESLGIVLARVVEVIITSKGSITSKQKILVCRQNNHYLIDAFCHLWGIETGNLIDLEASICFWSVDRCSSRNSLMSYTRPRVYQ